MHKITKACHTITKILFSTLHQCIVIEKHTNNPYIYIEILTQNENTKLNSTLKLNMTSTYEKSYCNKITTKTKRVFIDTCEQVNLKNPFSKIWRIGISLPKKS